MNPLGQLGSNLSIMIPTFNCAADLGQTLASLLEQPPDTLEGAQIQVVDDCSTRDDPAAVVAQIGAGRIGFYRHSQNLGVCRNFNSCFDLAKREWIQILHGDDYMLPGAYQEFAACLEQFPVALAVFARSQVVSSRGEALCESEALGPEERGRLAYDPRKWGRNLIYPAAVLLHRRVIESVGKFDPYFSHVNDWNYWWRLARTGECVYSRACIAAYRVSEGSHSASLVRQGLNVTEGLDQVERLIASLAEESGFESIAIEPLYEGVYETAHSQAYRFAGDLQAFRANWRSFRRMPRRFRWAKRGQLARLWLRHARAMIRRKSFSPRSK